MYLPQCQLARQCRIPKSSEETVREANELLNEASELRRALRKCSKREKTEANRCGSVFPRNLNFTEHSRDGRHADLVM